ncbi:hypothetical protein A9K75_09145 [Campylobacter fetus subsp. testudinum]|uniref:DNA adenine methylase n=1 Tax=Campylobacter fetus TaxID=196 RepID=UPI000818A81C|nr:DNA adenine methylase [Campylobacter fetus]OCR98949.1 hypothetical protein A9K75_09145 [Campylobacter fetus subsp. testudinum]
MQEENTAYLCEQIISYLGNKRSLLGDINVIIADIKKKLNKDKISFADVFSSSGIVSRIAKSHANLILANDLERYSYIINSCYLENGTLELKHQLHEVYNNIVNSVKEKETFISQLYAPKDDNKIVKNERVFYSRKNALILGGFREEISKLPLELQHFFIAPIVLAVRRMSSILFLSY